jgi:hypothetical protein
MNAAELQRGRVSNRADAEGPLLATVMQPRYNFYRTLLLGFVMTADFKTHFWDRYRFRQTNITALRKT